MKPSFELRLWPDPATGPYRLRLWIGQVSGRPSVVGVELWGITPLEEAWPPFVSPGLAIDMGWDALREAGITSEAIRLPIRQLLQQWIDKHRALARAASRMSGADQQAVAAYLKGLGPARRGRPSLPDELLQLVAQLYTEALADGRFDPAKAVGLHLSNLMRRELSPSTVRRWIAAARERGFPIPPAPHRAAPSAPKARGRGRVTRHQVEQARRDHTQAAPLEGTA